MGVRNIFVFALLRSLFTGYEYQNLDIRSKDFFRGSIFEGGLLSEGLTLDVFDKNAA